MGLFKRLGRATVAVIVSLAMAAAMFLVSAVQNESGSIGIVQTAYAAPAGSQTYKMYAGYLYLIQISVTIGNTTSSATEDWKWDVYDGSKNVDTLEDYSANPALYAQYQNPFVETWTYQVTPTQNISIKPDSASTMYAGDSCTYTFSRVPIVKPNGYNFAFSPSSSYHSSQFLLRKGEKYTFTCNYNAPTTSYYDLDLDIRSANIGTGEDVKDNWVELDSYEGAPVAAGTVSCTFTPYATQYYFIRVSEIDGYSGAVSVQTQVTKKSFTYDTSDVYNGKAQSANVTTKDNIAFKTYYRRQTKGSSYAGYTTSGPKYPGFYHVYVKVGNSLVYLGGYHLNPAAPKYSKTKAYNNAEKVYWSRKTSSSNTTGYEVAYRLTSSKSWHYAWASGRTTSNKLIKKLGNHKYYYVKIRVYKTSYGHKYYSSWTGQRKTPRTK